MPYERLKTAILKHVPFSDEEAATFCNAFQPQRYKPKEYLLRAGEICRFEGFVAQGCLRVFALDARGGEHVLYFAPEDWWVTDLDSFTNQQPSWLFVQALEPSTVLQITKADKDRLYAALPATEKLFRIMGQKTLVALQRRMLSALSQTADARYLAFVGKYPALAQRLTQQQVAAYLGITHEFLSKIRRRLGQKK
ncbi:Crp/Fnr family transcriptional regulator [Hymenobacter terricola]|uniref:Crp/Fnr family transcriptional regulator n=1 Tax=Hymenobacter terricola TaxID=2819236 RepID=UPI001B318587|nr:Crp/Fnr family transcriptional regulator [Hymenobacter terricola]